MPVPPSRKPARRSARKPARAPAGKPARSAAPAPRSEFDAGYFRRFYRNARSRAHSRAQVATLAAGLDGLAAWLHVEVRSVLDAGAGPGFLRDWFRAQRPAVRYRSIDVSPFACEAYGHEQQDLARFRDGRYDLIVCQGVLQYLDDRACARAIDNLGAMARRLLYLEVVTDRDLREVCDPSGTDAQIHRRSGAWYRKRLGRCFDPVGAGLWAAREAGLAFYELEAPGLRARK